MGIRTKQGLKVIDLEYMSVACSAIDLGFSFATWCKTSWDRRSFVKAYLDASGCAAEPYDVDALVVDACACSRFAADFCPDWQCTLKASGKFNYLLKAAHTDPNLCSAIIQGGLLLQ